MWGPGSQPGSPAPHPHRGVPGGCLPCTCTLSTGRKQASEKCRADLIPCSKAVLFFSLKKYFWRGAGSDAGGWGGHTVQRWGSVMVTVTWQKGLQEGARWGPVGGPGGTWGWGVEGRERRAESPELEAGCGARNGTVTHAGGRWWPGDVG